MNTRIVQDRPAEVYPGGERIQKTPKPRINCAGQATSSPPAAQAPDRAVILLRADQGETLNHNAATSGAGVAPKDYSTVHSGMPGHGMSFPGAGADDNSIYWHIPIPTNMHATPNIRVRLHVLAE